MLKNNYNSSKERDFDYELTLKIIRKGEKTTDQHRENITYS